MGYAVYFVSDTYRWQGYAVPGVCDVVGCEEVINLGLGYKCDGDDCWLCFCGEHNDGHDDGHDEILPKLNVQEWIDWMLADESWAQWREENPRRVELMRGLITA
jgi:hypothetical protein